MTTTLKFFALGIVVRSGPPLPPCPVAPWHETQLSAKTAWPAVALPLPAALLCPRLRGDARALAGCGGGAEGAVEAEEPEVVAVGGRASELPPARNATYSLPFIWKIVAVLFAPAPVWKLQSRSPFVAL